MASVTLNENQIRLLLSGKEIMVEDNQGGCIDIYPVLDVESSAAKRGTLGVVSDRVSVRKKGE